MMKAVPQHARWSKKKYTFYHNPKSGVDTDSWNIYVGTEGLLLGGFDHLPSKRSLPKMSGSLQSGWCGTSWDECSLLRPPHSCQPLYQLGSLGIVRKDVSLKNRLKRIDAG